MIQTEIVTICGKQFQRTWSDSGCLIERDGARYAEAIDPLDSGQTYTETDALIEAEHMTETEEKAAAYDILMGVTE